MMAENLYVFHSFPFFLLMAFPTQIKIILYSFINSLCEFCCTLVFVSDFNFLFLDFPARSGLTLLGTSWWTVWRWCKIQNELLECWYCLFFEIKMRPVREVSYAGSPTLENLAVAGVQLVLVVALLLRLLPPPPLPHPAGHLLLQTWEHPGRKHLSQIVQTVPPIPALESWSFWSTVITDRLKDKRL